jgi:uncharacterized repeat protein (TIGR01451 family)
MLTNRTLRIFLLLIFCGINCLKAQYINLPDSNWGKWLNAHNYSSCLSGNSNIGWKLDTTCAALSSATIVNCSNSSIHALTGITYFPNLNELWCDNNQLSVLPQIPSSLDLFSCRGNQLTSLPPLPPHLRDLSCQDNQLTILPHLPETIRGIDCYNNQLTSIPNFPDSLTIIWCNNNQLTNLPRIPSKLNTLFCYNNQLTDVPALPQTILYLNVSNNPNLSCLPAIQKSVLEYFYIAGTNIRCLPNRFSANTFDVRPDTMSLCEPTSGCDFYYNISGNVHQFTGNDCLEDSIHPGTSLGNIKVILKRQNTVEQQFYTSFSGNYTFKTDSFATYTIELDTATVPIVTSCPVGYSHILSTTSGDSIHSNEDFAVSCGLADALIYWIGADRFRPTFDTRIMVGAGERSNVIQNLTCDTPRDGIVTVRISGPVQYIAPASGAVIPTNVSGNILTYSVANLNLIQPGSLDILVRTDINAPIGSEVCVTAIITPTHGEADISNDSLKQCFTIRNSYDPNLKEVFPADLSPNLSEWLNYTIHFQNTGNDTAYTVVIKDTLSNDVLPETFEYLVSSHKAVVQIVGREMTFTFPKINLVDSGTNAPLSEGWIQYRVKTKTNLPLTSAIKNTAYIIFDSNPAIATNTVVSSARITNSIPFAIKDNGFRIYPNPNNGSFQLLLNADAPLSCIIYDIDGRIVAQRNVSNNRETIVLSSIPSGIYVLVVTNAGYHNTTRFIVER